MLFGENGIELIGDLVMTMMKNNLIKTDGWLVLGSLESLIDALDHGCEVSVTNGFGDMPVEYHMGDEGYFISCNEFDCPLLNRDNFEDLVSMGYMFIIEK